MALKRKRKDVALFRFSKVVCSKRITGEFMLYVSISSQDCTRMFDYAYIFADKATAERGRKAFMVDAYTAFSSELLGQRPALGQQEKAP